MSIEGEYELERRVILAGEFAFLDGLDDSDCSCSVAVDEEALVRVLDAFEKAVRASERERIGKSVRA